jgi:hypothetical protein
VAPVSASRALCHVPLAAPGPPSRPVFYRISPRPLCAATARRRRPGPPVAGAAAVSAVRLFSLENGIPTIRFSKDSNSRTRFQGFDFQGLNLKDSSSRIPIFKDSIPRIRVSEPAPARRGRRARRRVRSRRRGTAPRRGRRDRRRPGPRSRVASTAGRHRSRRQSARPARRPQHDVPIGHVVMPDIPGASASRGSDQSHARAVANSPVQADACGCWCMPVLPPE